MICALDVDYQDTGVTCAAVGFDAWSDAVARLELVLRSPGPAAAYQPGAFYERELPYLLAALEHLPPVEAIVIDGYVWLGPERPGLGWHLHQRVGGCVLGVAKTTFEGAEALEVIRGDSARPLYVTSIGIPPAEAAARIGAMHGEHRMPTLLRLVDGLARGRR